MVCVADSSFHVEGGTAYHVAPDIKLRLWVALQQIFILLQRDPIWVASTNSYRRSIYAIGKLGHMRLATSPANHWFILEDQKRIRIYDRRNKQPFPLPLHDPG